MRSKQIQTPGPEISLSTSYRLLAQNEQFDAPLPTVRVTRLLLATAVRIRLTLCRVEGGCARRVP